MKTFRSFRPNSRISDVELKESLEILRKTYPLFDLKELLRNKKFLWTTFKHHFPHADLSRFREETDDGVENVFFQGTEIGVWSGGHPMDLSVLDFQKREDIRKALGQANTFPDVLMPTKKQYPIPGIPFHQKVIDIASALVKQKIHVSPRRIGVKGGQGECVPRLV